MSVIQNTLTQIRTELINVRLKLYHLKEQEVALVNQQYALEEVIKKEEAERIKKEQEAKENKENETNNTSNS